MSDNIRLFVILSLLITAVFLLTFKAMDLIYDCLDEVTAIIISSS